MPQIAQQDYIVIDIANISSLTNSEKAIIKKHIENGTIWDVIISVSADTDFVFYRVVGFSQVGSEVYLGSSSIQTVYYGE